MKYKQNIPNGTKVRTYKLEGKSEWIQGGCMIEGTLGIIDGFDSTDNSYRIIRDSGGDFWYDEKEIHIEGDFFGKQADYSERDVCGSTAKSSTGESKKPKFNINFNY